MAQAFVAVNVGTSFATKVDTTRGNGANITGVNAAIATAAADTDVIASATAPAKVAAITTALTGMDDVVLVYNTSKLTTRNQVRAVLAALADALKGIGATNG